MKKAFTLIAFFTFLVGLNNALLAQHYDMLTVKYEEPKTLIAGLDQTLISTELKENESARNEKPKSNAADDWFNVSFDFNLISYPNPFANEVNLEFLSPVSGEEVMIKVRNSLGMVVYAFNFVSLGESWTNQLVNFDEFASGVYYITLATGDITETLKVIKQD